MNAAPADPAPSMAALVPELLVSDVAQSLRFWRDLCGFRIMFERLYEGFAFIEHSGAQVMLEERGRSRNWVTGPLDVPYGRGINFQIALPDIQPILEALASANWPLFMQPEEKWYRAEEVEIGVRQFLVQDPDGYLIRFSQRVGTRPDQGA
ncbi:bleomycin resistance protein [Pseudoroseomonas ludipueritiae]|nr:VOC family protein [Pseudoroseomonas ludipueritiae]